jgi:hypothetical protein
LLTASQLITFAALSGMQTFLDAMPMTKEKMIAA